MSRQMPENRWTEPPEMIRLAERDLHVWRTHLDQPAAIIQTLFATLSDEERERAARFHFPGGAENYIVGRGVLRNILGRYLGIGPEKLVFAYTSHGKPFLADECAAGAIRFNLAHSGRLAIYAFVRNCDVGIDIEKNRPDFAGQRIADRFFSPREAYTLRALPKEQREEGFLNCWTRKEAYIKARGEGLSFPLDAFDVTLIPGEPAALIATQGDAEEAGRWSMVALDTEPEYAAAVAVRGHGHALQQFVWNL